MTGSLSRSFWRRWKAKHSSLTMKRQGNVSMNRALNCTREMAASHLDELATELQLAEIFTNAKQLVSGAWEGDIDTSRIFNHDETPQFVNYGVDGTPNGLVFACRGESCKLMIRENRECVTIHPFVSVAGEVCMCHVLFAGKGITTHMAPKEAVDKIKNLLISTTERGTQDHVSLLAAYKLFDRHLTESNVKRPVVVLSDGHSSRFNYDVLKFLQDNQIRLFLSPPDTTGVTQLLDQVNKNLHLAYKTMKQEMFTPHMTVNREAFMKVLANMWESWVTSEFIRKAAKRVGISAEGLNTMWMQQDKFAHAEKCIQKKNDAPSSSASPGEIQSPLKIRKYSAAYYKYKFEQAQLLISDMHEASLNLDDIPGFLPIEKVTPTVKTTKTRVTQIYGSLEGKDVLKIVKEIQTEKDKKEKAKVVKADKKVEERELFYKCKDKCVCEATRCAAASLKECPSCRNILKSVCSKSLCRVDGKKPEMILPACSSLNPRKRLALSNKCDTDSESDLDENVDDVYDTESEDEFENVSDNESDDESDEVSTSINQLKETWKSLSPPINESEIIGKWYGLSWTTKKSNTLFVGKLVRRFLEDENGPVDSLLMRCLKPKVGSGIILEDTPSHLPPDESNFSLYNVIAGPLEVLPKSSTRLEVPSYKRLKAHFDIVSKINRIDYV